MAPWLFEPEIKRRLRDLRNVDWKVRCAAARALGEIGDVRALDGLLLALNDKDGRVQSMVAEALGQIGDAGAVEGLLNVLHDSDEGVRSYAVGALGEIGGPRAVDGLIRALSEGGISAFCAVVALGEIGLPAINGLLEALHSRDVISSCAAESLVGIGDTYELPRKVLAESCLSPAERAAALQSLGNVRYNDTALGRKVSLHYSLPDITVFCQQNLEDSDTAVREGARVVLEYLEKHSALLRPAERQEREEGRLLRPASNTLNAESSEDLLRASEPSLEVEGGERKKRNILGRILRRG